MGGPHPYEDSISLDVASYAIGAYLLVAHSLMLWKPAFCKEWLLKLPRHHTAGIYTLGVGMIWFWLLIAPENMGVISTLTMDIGEFNVVKPYLRYLVPLAFLGMVVYAKEFLFVRSLGVFALMVTGPLLEASMNKQPDTRLLVAVFSYLLLTKALFWVGMPFTFRDLVTWATANDKRWRMLALGGLVYGVATLLCAVLFWGGH